MRRALLPPRTSLRTTRLLTQNQAKRPRPAVAGLGALSGRCVCETSGDAEHALRAIGKSFRILATSRRAGRVRVAVLFRSKATYGKLYRRSTSTRAAWDRYLSHPPLMGLGGAKKSHIEKGRGEAYRWREDATRALAHLQSQGIRAVRVAIVCQVEIVQRRDAQAEPVLWLLEKVFGAESARTLLQELCLSRGQDAEVMKIVLAGDAVSLSGLLAGLRSVSGRGARDKDPTKEGEGHATHTPLTPRAHEQHLIDAVDQDDRTPLFKACELGHLGCVKVLLAAGSRADRVSADGQTPLQAAVEAGHADVVAELIVTSRVLSGALLVEYWQDVVRKGVGMRGESEGDEEKKDGGQEITEEEMLVSRVGRKRESGLSLARR